MRPKGWRGWSFVPALCALLVVAVSSTYAEPGPVRYDGGRLSVAIDRMPAGELLTLISQATGAEIRGNLDQVEPVSARFEDVPLRGALERLLGRQPFWLAFGPAGEVRVVQLIGTGDPVSIAAGTPPTSNGTPASADSLAAMLDQYGSVEVGRSVARELGVGEMGLRELLETGVRHEEASKRALALRAGIKAIEEDAGLRDAWQRAVRDMNVAQAAAILRRLAGDRAEEVALRVRASTRFVDVRQKASGVAEALRGG